ncbi:MAG: ATP-binding protein, partial [Muribaculaceae bacterium]|nr:ATP-binding protein [Muribaculaceae bacterium]
PGMSPEVMANLFQPFFTTKEDGSGVGLSLCRQIVRRHGGDLHIQSQQGKGTVVSVNLY